MIDIYMLGETKLKQSEGFAGHQLEKLYALEKVDPRTIRTYVPQNVAKNKVKEVSNLEPHREIGGGYPILGLFDVLDRLKLPPTLQYQLKKEEFRSISDVLVAEESGHSKILALPHAHLEILRTALKPWKDLARCGRVTKIDFKGYFRGLSISVDPICFLVLLDEVGLLNYMEATPYEKIQIERLGEKEKRELSAAALENISFKEEVETLFQGLLFGWIEERGGITTKKELIERLEQESIDPGAAAGFLHLLEKKKRAPWQEFEGIIYFDRSLRKRLNEIRSLLKEFYYRPKMSYDLFQLEELIQRELLRFGECLDALLLKRFLLLSNGYRLERRDLVHYTVHL